MLCIDDGARDRKDSDDDIMPLARVFADENGEKLLVQSSSMF